MFFLPLAPHLFVLMSPSPPALQLSWSFGFNDSCGVHSLSSPTRTAIFYATAHTGIIYDYQSRTQLVLQGHCNPITSAIVSSDKKWIVTADAGEESVVVIWDSVTGAPVKTLYSPHENGVEALSMSSDAMFVATLGKCSGANGEAGEQDIKLWEWTVDNGATGNINTSTALYTSVVPGVTGSHNAHTHIAFNPMDVREIVTNGPSAVIFWSWENFSLAAYSPTSARKSSSSPGHGKFIKTIFLPETTQAMTGTTGGEVILWDKAGEENGDESEEEKKVAGEEGFYGAVETNPVKTLVKSIKLCEGAIEWLSTMGSYLVVAGADGAVRFYDFSIRIVAWFEDLNAGPVTSVSFAEDTGDAAIDMNGTGGGGDGAGGNGGAEFNVPDFVIGTRTSYVIGVEASLFAEIEPENRRGALLVQGIGDEVPSIASHPLLDRLVIACHDGTLQLWDIVGKSLLTVQSLSNEQAITLRPSSVKFDPLGKFLAVGMTSGSLKISDAESMQDVANFNNGEACITFLSFSGDGEWLAVADANHYVSLYNYEHGAHPGPEMDGSESPPSVAQSSSGGGSDAGWKFTGRHRSHTAAITGLEFATREDGRMALVSVAEDRFLVEYDLAASSFTNGVVLRNDPIRIEQTAVPTCCLWHPLLGGDFEDRVITANDEFKLKQWNADNKSCRRTSLSPTFGGPLNGMKALPKIDPEKNAYGVSEFVVYSTGEKVVGMMKLPLDGNPRKCMGLIAHPSEISSMDNSRDGRWLMTSGKTDRCVNIWQVNTDALDVQEIEAEQNGEGIGGKDIFKDLIDEQTYEDLVDYFYYAQLRTQGERTTKARKITGFINLDEIPNMMRALGFYPSEEEITNMIAEVKYQTFTETGEVQTKVDLDTFVKLFANHKPVFGVSKDNIEDAFSVLAATDGKIGRRGVGEVEWGGLVKLLREKGEAMSDDDLNNCLAALLAGDEVNLEGGVMNGAEFSDKVLGFEEEGGEEEEVGGGEGEDDFEY